MQTINRQRLLDNLRGLAEIGRTVDGGVSRTALSAADVAGRTWFRDKAAAAHLTWRQDGAGNLSAVLPADDPRARTILLGSHLDTVPNGGRYDGALGVLAALEVVQTIREAGRRPSLHLEVISFTDEEGSHVGLLGSRALAGLLAPDDLAQLRQGEAAFAAGLKRLGLTRSSILAAGRDPRSLVAYLELHVEQGTRLEEAGIDIGVVTATVGIRPYWLHFQGQAAHAGTTPMDQRADALWGAALFIERARALVMERFTPGVMNVGRLEVAPGAFNIVPDSARLALEFRHGSEAALDEMAAALLAIAHGVARELGLALDVAPVSDSTAAPMDGSIMQLVEQAAADLGLRSRRLLSFAGHDAQAVSRLAPSGMIFVPSVGGVSHHPREHTADEDIVNGANTLLHTVLKLLPERQSVGE